LLKDGNVVLPILGLAHHAVLHVNANGLGVLRRTIATLPIVTVSVMTHVMGSPQLLGAYSVVVALAKRAQSQGFPGVKGFGKLFERFLSIKFSFLCLDGTHPPEDQEK
jgi:hypothetical protein